MISIKTAQIALREKGFYSGSIDGIQGPKTDAAITAFKSSVGLLARPYLGPITYAALVEGRSVSGPETKSEPVWLRRARQEIGVKEIAGTRHNAKILSWWGLCMLPFSDDETPWCAGFVGAMLEDCGIKSTRSGLAKSYSRSGLYTKLQKPIPGCIVVFWRGDPKGSSGHVGFLESFDQHGNLMILGGNQGDAVNIKPFSQDRVVGYYWPVGYPLPGEVAVSTVASDGKVSTNEA